MFANKSLKVKLLLAISLIVSFIVIIAAFGLYSSKKTSKEFNQIVTHSIPSLQATSEIRVHSLLLQRNLSNILKSYDHAEALDYKDQWQTQTLKHEEIHKDYEKSGFVSQDEEVLWNQYLKEWKDYITQSKLFLDMQVSSDPETVKKASLQLNTEVTRAFLTVGLTARKIWDFHVALSKTQSAKADKVNEQAQWTTLIISAIGVVIAILIGLWFANLVSRTISDISNEIAGSATETSSASHELTSASSTLSNGAKESASAIVETVASLEELSSMVKLNSDHAKEANSISQRSLSSAQNGDQEIGNLIQAMNEMTKSSKKIEEIINVIDDIAFQTNLLALNAAVEAARAGEQGKGFAVVADAVRSLAQRSAVAAKDINTLIKENVEKTIKGSKIADNSGSALKEIVNSAKKVADLNSEISAASQEQANGIEQIAKAMNHLDQAIQNNATSSAQVASSAGDLTTQAESLDFQVSLLRSFVNGKGSEQRSHEQPHSPKPSTKQQHKMKLIKPVHNSKVKQVLPLDDHDTKIGKAEGF